MSIRSKFKIGQLVWVTDQVFHPYGRNADEAHRPGRIAGYTPGGTIAEVIFSKIQPDEKEVKTPAWIPMTSLYTRMPAPKEPAPGA